MGPKKKGKKKGDKKKKAATEESANAASEIQMEEGTKQYYMTQILSLEKKVASLQQECDEFVVTQKDNEKRKEKLKEIRFGSRAYLGRQMDEINLEINQLNRQLRELDDIKEAERADLTKQLHELRTRDLQETKEKNENENHMLRSKLNALDELKTKKEALLSEIDELDAKLREQQHDYQEDVYYREKDAVLEKDGLRKEMGTRVNDLSSEFRRVSKMQVVQTTRQIIQENVRLNNKMVLVETDYNEIEDKNGKIRDQKKSKSLEYSLLEERERMMARKNRKTYQLIEKLTDECTANEQFISSLEEKVASYAATQQLIDELEDMNEKAKQRRNDAAEENQLLRRAVAQREEAIAKCEQDIYRAERVIGNVVRALQDVTQDPNEAESSSSPVEIRFRAFENILLLLNLSAQLGVGPSLNDLAGRNEAEPLTVTADDGARVDSPSQPLGTLRKVKTKSVAIQTSVSHRNPIPYHFQQGPTYLPPPHSSTFNKRRPSLLSA